MSFWLDDPTILLKNNKMTQVIPSNHYSLNENLNALTRIVLFVSLVGLIVFKHYIIIILAFIIIGLIIIYHRYNLNKEYFHDYSEINGYTDVDISKNPFNNSLLKHNMGNFLKKKKINPDTSYGKTPSYEIVYNQNIEDTINNNVKNIIKENNKDNDDIDKIFKNTSDNIEFENHMRNFYTEPVNNTPNDLNGFLSYCYGSLPSNKSVISY